MKKTFLFYLFCGLIAGFMVIGCSSQTPGSPVFSASGQESPRSFSSLMDDSIISARIKTKMISDDFVKAGPIDVDVHNGVAYLKGTVETDSQKRMTGDLARGVEGVIRVENMIKVK